MFRIGRANNEDEEEKAEWVREERFILNLTRFSLETDAVFPEHFFEFIVHLTNDNVSELVFIESGYTSVLFNDPEFSFPSCDIEYFIKKFEKAKKEENDEFLLAVQKVHRKARLVLDMPGVKDKIKQTIEERRIAFQRKSLFKGFSWMFCYIERYGDCPGSSIFQHTIVDVVNNKHLQLLMAPNASSDVVTSPS